MRLRRNGDAKIRELARRLRETGDPELAVALAVTLERSGRLPEGGALYAWQRSNETVLGDLPSYPVVVDEWKEGPDLCMVPVVRNLLWAKVGSGSYGYGSDNQAHGQILLQGESDPGVPGLAKPVNRHSRWTQSFNAHFTPCPDLRPLMERASPRAKRLWPMGGGAAFQVEPGVGVIRGLNIGYDVQVVRPLLLRFLSDRDPPHALDRQRRAQGELLRPLTDVADAWVREHPEAFEVAGGQLDTTAIRRALQDVRRQENQVAHAHGRLGESQAQLAETLLRLLPGLGL